MKPVREYVDLGSFTMTGDVMRVSDQSYDDDMWCCGTIKNCKTGKWNGIIAKQDEGSWGVRVSMVAAIHQSSRVNKTTLDKIRTESVDEDTGDWQVAFPKDWKEGGFTVGVDSGQAGLFDDLMYDKDEQFAGCEPPSVDFGSLFYNHCCDLTLSDACGGVIPNGVVSSSGYGDGSYVSFYHCAEDGEVNAVVILFL